MQYPITRRSCLYVRMRFQLTDNIYLTTVPVMAIMNSMENNAPRILSKMKAFLILDLGCPSIFGMERGPMKTLVPERYARETQRFIAKCEKLRPKRMTY
jgi:hypothetical protein